MLLKPTGVFKGVEKIHFLLAHLLLAQFGQFISPFRLIMLWCQAVVIVNPIQYIFLVVTLVDLPQSGEATVKKIEAYDIDVTSLTRNQVIHAQTSGSTKDISFLYVQNVTKSASQFGVVTQALSSNQYTVLYGTTSRNISTAYRVNTGDGVEVTFDGSSVSATPLTRLDRGSIEGYESGKIRVNSKTYVVSDYVEIYGGMLAKDFSSMSVEEMLSDNTVSVTLYSDQSAQNGGVVRVIVVQTKV